MAGYVLIEVRVPIYRIKVSKKLLFIENCDISQMKYIHFAWFIGILWVTILKIAYLIVYIIMRN